MGMTAMSRRRGRGHRIAMIAASFWAIAAVPPASAEAIAVTFDDLPVFDARTSSPEAATITANLLAAVTRNHVPAIGFVNEGKLAGADREQGTALLERWLAAGLDLGNHGYSHLSFDKTKADIYIADAAAGDAVTKRLLGVVGRRERWWRYPYLETGPTAEDRRLFDDWLRSAHYRVAPVTAENSDYLFADAYDAALAANDAEGAARVRRSYLDYSRRIIAWYRSASVALLGRRIPLVLLLHASRLNADAFDALATALRDDGFRFASLDRVMRDRAYAQKDAYVGPDGIEWLERWSMTLHRDLPWNTLPAMPKL